jgi:hypothetical protein
MRRDGDIGMKQSMRGVLLAARVAHRSSDRCLRSVARNDYGQGIAWAKRSRAPRVVSAISEGVPSLVDVRF